MLFLLVFSFKSKVNNSLSETEKNAEHYMKKMFLQYFYNLPLLFFLDRFICREINLNSIINLPSP